MRHQVLVEEGGPPITRCPLHGIAYDEEREVCPECAEPGSASPPAATARTPRLHAGAVSTLPASNAPATRRGSA